MTAPLPRPLNARLSVMMFLQYAIWGAWLPLFFPYLTNHVKLTPEEAGNLFAIGAVGALVAPFIAGQIADRWFNTERFLAISHIAGAALVWQLGSLDSYDELMPFALLYSLVFRMTPRGTLGYRTVGIRYAHMLSDRPAWTALAYRAAIALFLLWIFALDHLWILFNRHKQAWHDKVAGFYVVRTNAQPIGTRRVVRRVINFMMLTFVVWEPVDSVD